MKENSYILTESALNEVLKYLGSRPYVEVAHVIETIKSASIVDVSEETNEESA